MPKVSVIIPCFNLGKYIQEALDSILIQTFQDFEIIVVNDGSTDSETNLILDNLDNSAIKLIKTDNQGLANARNTGIAEAMGDYILPLDADDKIDPTYLEKAVKILGENQNIGIVYCQAEFFGEENSKWDLPEFQLSKILIDNMIFASSFFRRADWKLVGGYKSTMIYGWEDYDFWLSIIELKREVYRIQEYLFYYRQRTDSMARVMTRKQFFYSYKEIVKNHKDLYVDNIEYIFEYIYSLRDIISEKQQSHSSILTEYTNLQESHRSLQNDYNNLQKGLEDTFKQLQTANENIESITRTKAWKAVNLWWNSKQKVMSWIRP
jgi:glycosyltransferase involved in cell wall biosynthesis